MSCSRYLLLPQPYRPYEKAGLSRYVYELDGSGFFFLFFTFLCITPQRHKTTRYRTITTRKKLDITLFLSVEKALSTCRHRGKV